VVVNEPLITRECKFEVYRTQTGFIYVSADYLASNLANQAKWKTLQIKLLVSLLSCVPTIIASNDSEISVLELEDCKLEFSLFEHWLFGGFLDFTLGVLSSQLIDYVLDYEENWRDPFGD
jgi:hypothetical protein